MALFPRLKTNAITQYPSGAGRTFRTEVLRFVDGAEQRFCQSADGARHWRIRLDLLDETEVDAVRKFFEQQSGKFGRFTFVDPWTNEEVANCAFSSDVFEVDFRSHNRAAASIEIVEVPA